MLCAGILLVAVVAAIFAFGGVALGGTEIATAVFFVFLILFVVSLLSGVTSNSRADGHRDRAHPI
jgi:uncharacterized membrane protein YtjA (UPF0391 family)